MQYNLVLATKRVLNETESQFLKDLFIRIGEQYGITLKTWWPDLDQVHIVFATHSTSQLSEFINKYKVTSTRLARQEFPNMPRQLWGNVVWNVTESKR